VSFTVLELARQATAEMGLSQPAVVVGAPANQTIQLLALIQRLLKDLVREHEWRRLVKTYVFQTEEAIDMTGDIAATGDFIITTLSSTADLEVGDVISGSAVAPYSEIASIDSATQVTMNMPSTNFGSVAFLFARQDYALPSDFDRMVADTNWDRTNHWRNLGPKSSQEWQTLQGGIISTGPRERFRIYGNKLRLWPAPTEVQNIAYEYVSKYAVIASGGTQGTKETFTVDTDTCIFPDDLMLAGVKYYFLKAKKLDFGIEMKEYAEILATRKGQDIPSSVESLSPSRAPELMTPAAIPEGTWDL
jgi:hypothetical protein